MDKTVGIIGLGIMGGAIARNLVERGWRVIGFDTDAKKRAELALANVEIAGNVEQVARDAPIIMTNFPSPGRRRGGRAEHRYSGQSQTINFNQRALNDRSQESLWPHRRTQS